MTDTTATVLPSTRTSVYWVRVTGFPNSMTNYPELYKSFQSYGALEFRFPTASDQRVCHVGFRYHHQAQTAINHLHQCKLTLAAGTDAFPMGQSFTIDCCMSDYVSFLRPSDPPLNQTLVQIPQATKPVVLPRTPPATLNQLLPVALATSTKTNVANFYLPPQPTAVNVFPHPPIVCPATVTTVSAVAPLLLPSPQQPKHQPPPIHPAMDGDDGGKGIRLFVSQINPYYLTHYRSVGAAVQSLFRNYGAPKNLIVGRSKKDGLPYALIKLADKQLAQRALRDISPTLAAVELSHHQH